MSELPWSERVNMLQINPDAARIEDIARMATELSDHQREVEELKAEGQSIVAQMHGQVQKYMREAKDAEGRLAAMEGKK